jgi:hypothetical protein
MLVKSYTQLRDQAVRIQTESLRLSFLEEVPAHREIHKAYEREFVA